MLFSNIGTQLKDLLKGVSRTDILNVCGFSIFCRLVQPCKTAANWREALISAHSAFEHLWHNWANFFKTASSLAIRLPGFELD